MAAFIVLEALGIAMAWQYSLKPALASHEAMEIHRAIQEGDCVCAANHLAHAMELDTPYLEDQVRVLYTGLDSTKACPRYQEMVARAQSIWRTQYERHKALYDAKAWGRRETARRNKTECKGEDK
jgi:hypothetical protein